MTKVYFAALLMLATAETFAVGAAQPAAKPAPAKTAAPAQEEVAYADLAKYVGKRVIVYTKLGSTRAGTLTKFSNSALLMKLDGGAELDIPAETVKRAAVPVVPPDPLFPTKP